jgi:guanylate kinase
MGVKPKKALIVSSPSGAGKTTIVHHLLERFPQLAFSVSATTRHIRKGETDGIDYYFFDEPTFRAMADSGAFIEWEEVYPGKLYGTLKSELERLWTDGKVIAFDVDVLGAQNLKRYFGSKALAIFIRPPSLDTLKQRLEARGTETPETMKQRLARAAMELEQEPYFDIVVVNDDLDKAKAESERAFSNFLKAKVL